MKKEDNPCYGCEKPKRHEGCHSTCDERKVYKEKLDAEKAVIKEGKRKTNDLFIAKVDGIRRMKHRRGSGHVDRKK